MAYEMNVMDRILELLPKVTITWYTGFVHNRGDSYFMSVVGTTDSCVRKAHELRIAVNGDMELYQGLLQLFTQLKKEDTDLRIISVAPYSVEERLDIKDECKTHAQEIESRNRSIKDQYYDLLKQLERLGCDTDDMGDCYPTLEKVPLDMYNYRRYTADGTIHVICHSDTILWKTLKDNGIMSQ